MATGRVLSPKTVTKRFDELTERAAVADGAELVRLIDLEAPMLARKALGRFPANASLEHTRSGIYFFGSHQMLQEPVLKFMSVALTNPSLPIEWITAAPWMIGNEDMARLLVKNPAIVFWAAMQEEGLAKILMPIYTAHGESNPLYVLLTEPDFQSPGARMQTPFTNEVSVMAHDLCEQILFPWWFNGAQVSLDYNPDVWVVADRTQAERISAALNKALEQVGQPLHHRLRAYLRIMLTGQGDWLEKFMLVVNHLSIYRTVEDVESVGDASLFWSWFGHYMGVTRFVAERMRQEVPPHPLGGDLV